ncbi:MAG: hypothetical protein AAFU71_16670 [Cyanobacteria bacterium J06632_22]
MPQAASRPVTAAVCKLLSYKGQYTPCHITVPDMAEKQAAVDVDGRYFSLFKRFDSAEKILNVAAKLAKRGEDIAITHSSQGYVMWIHEEDATLLKLNVSSKSIQLPTFGPASCYVIVGMKSYRPCYIKVPDLTQPMVAIYYAKRFYSVYRRSLSAADAIEIAKKLVARGDEVAIAPTRNGHAICVWEPEAVPFNPQNN